MTTDFITRSLTARKHLCGILSLLEFSNLAAPSPCSALPPPNSFRTLALKLFRGEPAISKFDWNFSAIHSTSPHFSTYVWFGPPRRLTVASACPWIGHPVSGLLCATLRPFETRFPYGSVALRLNLATHSNSQARSTKSTPPPVNGL